MTSRQERRDEHSQPRVLGAALGLRFVVGVAGCAHWSEEAELVFDDEFEVYQVVGCGSPGWYGWLFPQRHSAHYFHHGHFYRYDGGGWCTSLHCHGPWSTLGLDALPAELRTPRVQERAMERWKARRKDTAASGGVDWEPSPGVGTGFQKTKAHSVPKSKPSVFPKSSTKSSPKAGGKGTKSSKEKLGKGSR